MHAAAAATANGVQILLLMAWREMTTSNDTTNPLGFWALAGLHGMNWPWNGQMPPTVT